MKKILTLICTSLISIDNVYSQELVYNISDEGLNFIKKQELFVPCAYWDINMWALGYGSREDLNGKNFKPTVKVKGKTKPFCVTEEYATEFLKHKIDIKNDLLIYYYIDNQFEINQKMHDALLSLSYNLGSYAVLRSSFIKHLKNKRCDLAAKSIMTYVKAGGITVKGLVIRRQKEASMLLEGCKELSDYYVTETPKPIKKKKIRKVLVDNQ
jgi:lysozyme